MKMNNLIVNAVALLFALSLSTDAATTKRKGKGAARPRTESRSKNELLDLLRRTQQAAEQAQVEARQARQQSEELKKQLEENTRELAMLRQSVEGQIADLRSRKDESKQEEGPTQPAAPNPAEEKSANYNPHSDVAAVEDRLDRLQEQVEVNTAQINEHAQTKVESDSRFRVKLFGMILANTYVNTDSSSLSDNPLAAPPPTTNAGKNNFGASLRQSRIGLAMEGPHLGEARLSAEAEFDFWGGTVGQSDGDVFGSLRVITASARLDWENTSLTVGQRPPLISPLNPTSIAALWIQPLTGAGNISQWRPQIMVERRAGLNDSSQVVIQGGLLTPFGESLQGKTIGGGPGYESRAAYRRRLDSDRKLEFGFGGYVHRRPFALGRHVNSYALTGDWMVPLGSRVEFTGEAFFGRAMGLAEESGSRIDSIYAVTGPLALPETSIRGVRSAGGWAQMAIKARSDLDFNFAYGQEDPRNRDIFSGQFGASTRFKNQVGSANFIWQLRQNFLLSLEYRRFWTKYALQQQTSGHYNLAVGYMF
jgi:tetrahydromethanopterin S-methyltransferase subunit G